MKSPYSYARKLAVLIFFLIIAGFNKAEAQTCNQVEILYTAPDCLQNQQNPGAAGGANCVEIGVCVNQPYVYSSSVIASGWTYNWTVAGPTSVTINPNNTSAVVNIVWPQTGTYTLTLTATDPSGNVFTYCLKINVIDKPLANFTFAPNNACSGSIISFTNTTTYSGSGVIYSWNFGDPSSGSNNYSTQTDPSHLYNSAGTYTVTLIASSVVISGGANPNDPATIKTCCADTITQQVTIKPGNIKIDCISTVCAGDTVKYTVSGCGSPTWLPPVGGTILSQSGNSATIIWGNGNLQGQILVQCPGGCIASIPVPIVPANPVITGNTSPCFNSKSSYSLPLLPGTFYTWTLTNLSTSTNYTNLISTYPDNNTAWINWITAPPGTYQLSIVLDNKHICCSSSGSLLITPKDSWTALFDQTICAGTAANLAVFPATGTFNWTVLPPNTGVSPLTGTGTSFNPVFSNPGIYTVEVIETANTYCNSGPGLPQQITVTVVGTPTPGTITGPATVCPGISYLYSMSSSAPAGYHYSWNITSGSGSFQPGNLSTTTGNSANIVWTVLPGTISVVLERNNFPFCPSAPVTLTVNQGNPGTITGPLTVCVDAVVSYVLTGSNLPTGEIINWSVTPSSNGTILSGQGSNSITILWHGLSGAGPWGPVTINANTACGNAIPLAGITIYPKFIFAITKSGTDICQPGGVTLAVTGAPLGSTYLWSPGGQSTSSISNITTAGTYSVTVTNGGCSFTNSYTVDDPFAIVPVACGVGTCIGANTSETLGVTVINPLSGSFTYQWYNGIHPSGTLISGATNATYTTNTDGNFYVVVTYGNCQKHVSFNVKKVCCPNVNIPQITSIVRNSCNSYTFTGTTPNPNGSAITWDFGDGNTASGISGVPITHLYASAGIYCVTFCVGPPNPNTTNCAGNCAATTVTVPIEAAFNYSLGCNGCLNVNNLSTVITSNSSFVTYYWDFGDGNNSTSANPSTHCYSGAGTYTVQLTITYNDGQVSCTSSATQVVNYSPLAIIINPTPVCTGSPATFNTVSGSFLTYEWDFGDGFFAFTPSTTHIYNSPGLYTVSLTVQDILGNVCTTTSTINVLPGITPCTIQGAYLCPGGSAALTISPVSGATYLWEIENLPNVFIPAPGSNTSNNYSATVPGFYHVVVTASNGCKCISNKAEVKSVPKPVAVIAVAPTTKLCGPGNVMLTSTNHLNGYTSEWYANGNYGIQIGTGQMYFAFGVSVTTVFNLVLTNEYGCKDTCSITVVVNPVPLPPNIIASPTICERVPITLTVTNYTGNITWNNGATGTSITVISAGTYTATYTDPVTGCKSSSNFVIHRRPPTDLFPHFCDKIPCECRDENGNFTIYAPKPLVGMFATNYNIQWYFNNNPVGSNGPNPFFTPALPGTYFIVVTDPVTGCKDTSDKYTISLLPCCDCEKSKWGEISLNPSELPAQVNNLANVPASQKLHCNKTYTLSCNQPYTVNANFICKENCPPKVTYSLQPPTGSPIIGNAPLTFIPVLTGTYTLTLYGWCGDKICDSCIIRFRVECPRDCCPYDIKVQSGKPGYNYNPVYDATIMNLNLAVSGLAGIPLTEVRAEVISYIITDNYNKECMKCQNFPYTWASMHSATNIGGPSALPLITMYNSTVHPFVPAGNGIYKNPREIIWSNGSTFSLPNNSPIGLNLLLPPPPVIDCCELKGKICLKLVFRNDKCKECEVRVCVDFEIKSRRPTPN